LKGGKMNQQFLVGVVLSGFLALGCEPQSTPEAGFYNQGSPQVRMVDPDGREFIGGPATVEVSPTSPVGPDRHTFVVAAGVAGRDDPTGRLFVGFSRTVESMGNPELIDAALIPELRPGAYGAVAENENGPVPSGRLHVELRAGRMTGRVDTPDGSYQITGSFSVVCWKQVGDHGEPDENRETPLCQRFANLYP
jgi:hypothetical protein